MALLVTNNVATETWMVKVQIPVARGLCKLITSMLKRCLAVQRHLIEMFQSVPNGATQCTHSLSYTATCGVDRERKGTDVGAGVWQSAATKLFTSTDACANWGFAIPAR